MANWRDSFYDESNDGAHLFYYDLDNANNTRNDRKVLYWIYIVEYQRGCFCDFGEMDR